jgi:hypothetical protein
MILVQAVRAGSLCIVLFLAGCCGNRGHQRCTGAWNDQAATAGVGPAVRRSNLLGFLSPGTADREAGLRLLEPYQRGKIPVVLIHGLLSSPDTWSDLISELRCRPDITATYQFWVFGYPTGVSFLRSAAQLRDELTDAVRRFDPAGTDPALNRMVLVGHSMGGLVAKLQVADSGPWLWASVSHVPFECIRADEHTRVRLGSALFFRAQPFVQRVIFIAVPHRGSSFAARFVGRASSLLVNLPDDDEERHRQLVRNNPHAFARFVERRLPTSIDMLQPGNPLLETIAELPIDRGVRLHSIIGTGLPMLTSGPADGVVPVSSALHQCVDSELYIPTTHRWVHRDLDTAEEVARILREHASALGRNCPSEAERHPQARCWAAMNPRSQIWPVAEMGNTLAE